MFFKTILSYNRTIISHRNFYFSLNNSYVIFKYNLVSKFLNNTLIIYCEKAGTHHGDLFYYDNETQIIKSSYNPLFFLNSIIHYSLSTYWRYELNNVKPGNVFLLFSSSKDYSFEDTCKVIVYEEEYRINDNIFYDSFQTSDKFYLKFIVNSFHRIQIGKVYNYPKFEMNVTDLRNNKTIYSKTSYSDINYYTDYEEYLVEFMVENFNNSDSTIKISFEKLKNKYANVLLVDEVKVVPLHSKEKGGVQNFFIDLDDYIPHETIQMQFNIKFYSRINVSGIFYTTNKLDLNKTFEDNSFYVESYNFPTIKENYISFEKTNDNQKSYILQVELKEIDYSSELFSIQLESLPKPITPKSKNYYQGIIKTIFYINEESFIDDSQYLFLYINETNNIYFSTNVTAYKEVNLIVLTKQQIMDIPERKLSIQFTNKTLTFEFQFKNDINLYYFQFNPANLRINTLNTFIDSYIIFSTHFCERNIATINTLYGDTDYYIIKDYLSIDNIFNGNYQKKDRIYLIYGSHVDNSSQYIIKIKSKRPSIILFKNYIYQIDSSLVSANSTSFCLYGRFDIKHIYFPYIFENLTIPLRINLISVNNSGVYNDSVVHVYNDYHNAYYRLNYSKNFFNGNFKIKDRLHITFDSMDETILIIYFPINLFLKYYEIIKKPQKKIIPKSNYLIFQFDDDFISFANLKIYSKANSKVSIFRYNGDDSKDIIGNDTFYFDFSQIYDLEYQNIYLDLDKPKPYLSIKPFISVFNYYENIMFDFQYFDFQTIYSYERYLKWLDNETSFRIYEYNNNPEFGKGQIFIDFFEVINQKMDLYIYREKKYIERSDDNKFENYIKKINIKGEKQIILNETTMDFYDKGLFYFVFSISDFSSNECINFILQIYNPNEYILIDEKQFNLMIAIHHNINLYFIIPKGRIHKKYLKYEWYNTNPNMSTSMYINSELDSFGVTNHSYREINNISYLINLVNEGKNESILYFSIKFEDEKLFYHLSNYDILRLNVLAPQMIYILNDISDEGFGETVYFNFYDSHFDKTPRVIFFDSNETLDDLPKKLEDFDEEMKIINGSYTCIKTYTRFVLIGIDVSFKQWQYFTFQKIFPNIFVQTNYSRYFSYSFKNFYINKESFHNSNTKILLYSNKYDTIISNSYIFHNGSNFFFITYDMINKVDEFRFRVNGYYYNTSFEIRYLDNIDIYYYFLEYRLNSINIQINDCSKKTYLISEYKYFNDTILYIKNLDKELNDYYYRNDGLYSNIDDFFNVNISLYEYPFKTKSLFDFIEFKCTAPTEIEINNVNIQKNYIITLNKGTTIPFFIEPYGRSFFRISNVSQIFEENFEIRVNLVTHKSRYLYINLNFSNEIITLNNQNPIKNKKFNKSYDDYIEFKGNNESILIFFFNFK